MSANNKGFAFEGLLMKQLEADAAPIVQLFAPERPECAFRNPAQRVTLLHRPPCRPVGEAQLQLIIKNKNKNKTKTGKWGVAWEN